jgi:hypothetical protein
MYFSRSTLPGVFVCAIEKLNTGKREEFLWRVMIPAILEVAG